MKVKNQASQLTFDKKSVTELTDRDVFQVIGGTGYVCSNCVTHTVTISLIKEN